MSFKPATIVLLLSAACSVSRVEETPDGSVVDELRGMVAAQGTAELNTWRASHSGFTPQQVTLLKAVDVENGGKVWRAVLPIDHSHPYTVLQKSDQLARLGGFPNPEVERAAELLGLRVMDSTSARAAARTLALLADQNGAEEYVVQGAPSPGDSLVLRAWRERHPFAWREDTVFRRPDGGWISRLTVLSRRTRSYEQEWQPTVYTFYFSADGRLRSWFTRVEDAFQAPVPVR